MTDQKTRWAAKAARYREWAVKAEDRAEQLYAPALARRGDVAFFTQPGRIVERERIHAKTERAYEESLKAKRLNERAANLERLATTNAGDAAVRHEAERQAVIGALSIGDRVDCIYGRCEVVKINRKSLRVLSRHGRPLNIDAHLCRKVA